MMNQRTETYRRRKTGSTMMSLRSLFIGSLVAWAPISFASETIGFSIDREALKPLGLGPSADVLEHQIGANLSSQGYAVEAGKGRNSELEATLGRIAKKSTPVGVSFSFGNSDPRAVDYQKAVVLPITCRWIEGGTLRTEITQEIAVSATTDPTTGKLTEKDAVDNLSSVCLTLLTTVRTPTVVPNQATGWKPPTRIEVRDADTGELISPAPQPVTDTKPTPASSEAKAGAASAPEPSQSTTVVTETPKTSSGHKKLIIHNLGDELELEFGYKRR